MNDLAVIMSVYHADRLQFVKEAVESILNQDYVSFDFYLAFDGPVDDDVDNYISSIKDQRIILCRLEQNRGLAFALNHLLVKVLSRPQVKFIARMDADDISLPDRFGKQRDYLLAHPEITVLGSWYEEIDEEGNVLRLRKLPEDHEKLRKRYLTRTPFAHPSVMFRRELIEVAGYYPEDTYLMEDNVLWGRAIGICLKFANLPEILFKFRIDTDFFRRRSGLEYGMGYIKTRIKLNKTVGFPFYWNLVAFIVGIIKMTPYQFLKKLYLKELI